MSKTGIGTTFATLAALALGACGGEQPPVEEQAAEASREAIEEPAETQITPGLTMRILEEGDGATASAGEQAVVHYTGWLYDEVAADNRGGKFDSSLDRGQHFRFVLGAGQVIEGWDRGVIGMQVGELRELTIAPQLAYGERGAGDVIPPNSTLVFEVRLAALEPGPDSPPAQ